MAAYMLILVTFVVSHITSVDGGDFRSVFCSANGMRCPKKNVHIKTAAFVNQCKAHCMRAVPECHSAYFDEVSYTCHLKESRCDFSELVQSRNSSVDLYRLKKGERRCPSGRHVYKLARPRFTRNFCAKTDVTCGKRNLYPFSFEFANIGRCLAKCRSVYTCAGVNYRDKTKECDLIKEGCTDDELEYEKGSTHHSRLRIGQTECAKEEEPTTCPQPQIVQTPPPSESACRINEGETCDCDAGYIKEGPDCVLLPTCPKYSTQSGTSCVCEKGYVREGSECVKGPWMDTCPTHSNHSCACNEGYLKKGSDCVKIACPERSKFEGTECVCESGYLLQGNECVQIKEGECPHRSIKLGASCICEAGYIPQGSDCAPAPKCPERSSRSGTDCICDSGYAERDGDCVKLPECPANMTLSGATCVCIPGYKREENGCVAVVSDKKAATVLSLVTVDPTSARHSPAHPDMSLNVSDNVLDENKGGGLFLDTCLQLMPGLDTFPWWRIHFVQPTVVTHVEIAIVHTCCTELRSNDCDQNCHKTLTTFAIFVDHRVCKYQAEFRKPNRMKHDYRNMFKCYKPVWGTALTIQGMWNRHLMNLCDIEIFGYASVTDPDPEPVCGITEENGQFMREIPIGLLPLDERSVEQSSQQGPGDAILAIDKAWNHYMTCSSTRHSAPEIAWWKVKLEERAIVYALHIFVLTWHYHLRNFEAFIDDMKCVTGKNLMHETHLVFFCEKPLCGTELTLKREFRQLLGICHIDVLGKRITEFDPRRKSCTGVGEETELPLEPGSAVQTDPKQPGAEANKAIDNSNLTCSNTVQSLVHGLQYREYSPIEYWKVRLAKDYIVTAIHVRARLPLEITYVLVDDEICTYIEVGDSRYNHGITIKCMKPICGKEVRIQHRYMMSIYRIGVCNIKVLGYL